MWMWNGWNILRLISKALMLIVLLVFSWAFVHVVNLLHGKHAREGNVDDLLSIQNAYADAPSADVPSGDCET